METVKMLSEFSLASCPESEQTIQSQYWDSNSQQHIKHIIHELQHTTQYTHTFYTQKHQIHTSTNL